MPLTKLGTAVPPASPVHEGELRSVFVVEPGHAFGRIQLWSNGTSPVHGLCVLVSHRGRTGCPGEVLAAPGIAIALQPVVTGLDGLDEDVVARVRCSGREDEKRHDSLASVLIQEGLNHLGIPIEEGGMLGELGPTYSPRGAGICEALAIGAVDPNIPVVQELPGFGLRDPYGKSQRCHDNCQTNPLIR